MKDKTTLTGIEGHRLYILQVGKYLLESDHPKYYPVRITELYRLKIGDLPKDVKFIFYDGTLFKKRELIAIKLIVEKISDMAVLMTIEESSSADRWLVHGCMQFYFRERLTQLRERELESIDLQLLSHYEDQNSFFLQYAVVIENKPMSQALRYGKSIIHTTNQAARDILMSAMPTEDH